MCGIAGAVAPIGAEISREKLERMTRVIAHRGPDGSGLWLSDDRRIGLGHRRLSIIDLSEAGAQPMASASGRYMISFNGEIYNFAELREELQQLGHRFRGRSDTEVMLTGFEAWGLQITLARLAGMFAVAVWDHEERTLLIARDRVGIKPLYYSTALGELIFGSELRALVAYRSSLPEISALALNEYLRLGYVPGPLSIFEGVFKLQPGCYAIYQDETLSSPAPYWRIEDAVRSGLTHQLEDESVAIEALEAQLRASVSRHVVSDVPLGAFLSGGVDSSTVVALMQSISPCPVKTFSIGFHEQGYNEAGHAAAVAAHLGTEHHELYVTEQDALAVIPDLPDIYDEPFADASQIPTFLVSRMARQHVTVSLSGDGGDELFAGYNRYVFVADFWRRLRRLPLSVRRSLSWLLSSVSPASWDSFFRRMENLLPTRFRPSLPGQKMHKVASILPTADLVELHRKLVAQWTVPGAILNPPWSRDMTNVPDGLMQFDGLSNLEQQMLWDTQSYLVDDILTKVDRASMRVGLEARVPFLDHEVLEFAWRVPVSMKVRADGGKWLLRQVLYRYVPRELVDRPKMGFSIPIDAWLRGPLRDWTLSNLAASRLDRDGILDGRQVNLVLSRHLDKTVDAGGPLWTLLMFQIWLERVKTWV
jgi:asparagine synthase (glutamine-hydrolysing)